MNTFLRQAAIGVLSFALGAPLLEAAEAPENPFYKGVTYAGYREGQSPLTNRFPLPEEVEEDMALLATVTQRVRTYSAREGRNNVSAIAAAHGLKVVAGAWISGSPLDDYREMDSLIEQANAIPGVERLIVGNEALLREDLTSARLRHYLRYVRARTDKPVSIAEPWGVWMEHPEMAEHVNYVAAHVLPYWEDVPIEKAVDYAFERIELLKKQFPGKPLVVTETGWPSAGETRGASVASPQNQARYLKAFTDRATREGVDYLIIEAFDQPWKQSQEGVVGAHWGLFTVGRHLK